MDPFDQSAEAFYNAGVPPEQAKQYQSAIDAQIEDMYKQGIPAEQAKQKLAEIAIEHQTPDGKRITIKPFSAPPPAMSDSPNAPVMSDAEFAKARQESAMQEPAFRNLSAATIPAIGAAASLLPAGRIAQGTINAGATAWNQLAGQEPYSIAEIAKSGIIPMLAPTIVNGIVNGAKGLVKGIGEFVSPQLVRKTGIEAAMQNLGVTPNTIDRAYASKASTAAYAGVRATAQEVPTNLLNRAVTNAINDLPRANPPAEAVAYLKNLSNTLDAEASLPYADIHKQINGMYARAKDLLNTPGQSEAGMALMNARSKIIEHLDNASPILKQANDAYRKELAIEKVSTALSKPAPDVKLGTLLSQDPLTKDIIPFAQAKQLENIAEQIARLGATGSPYSGLGGRIVNFITKPVASLFTTDVGRSLLRRTFASGPLDSTKLAMLAQFGRAYMAQNKSSMSDFGSQGNQ